MDTPIFRPVEPGKSYISKMMSLKYTDFDFHLKQLGMFARFPDGVRSYDLRRGAASAIGNSEVTVVVKIREVDAAHSCLPLYGIHYAAACAAHAFFCAELASRSLGSR